MPEPLVVHGLGAAWFTVLVLCVGGERIAELYLARRHRRWAMAHGGIEFGSGHYGWIVAVQLVLLVGSLVESWARRPQADARIFVPMIIIVLAAQSLRWWCIRTLGRQWNTRVIVIPGAERVVGGPYRWLRHPNYLAVVVEGAALPLAGGAWTTAIVVCLAHLLIIPTRIRVENRALRRLRS